MTYSIDSDHAPEISGKQPSLGFESSQLEMAGIRVTRAEFARLMSCSKQAVTDWVKSGRIVVGPDGRFDPRQAVRSLLATGDPARLRSKILAPLVRSLSVAHERISALENELTATREEAEEQIESAHEEAEEQIEAAREEAEFERESASDFVRVHEALPRRIFKEWGDLVQMSAPLARSAIEAWLDLATEAGGDPGLSFAEARQRAGGCEEDGGGQDEPDHSGMDYDDPSAPVGEEDGAGERA